MSENINIQDGSGDKEYFTIIPNYILNHSTLWDREVYIQMKRITGEKGTCWTSRNTLAKQCGISVNRLQKSIKYLVDHKWIEFLGKKTVNTKGGIQEVNEYRVCNLWDLNNSFYKNKGGSSKVPPLSKGGSRDYERGVTETAKGGHQVTSNKNHINKNHINNIAEINSADIPKVIKAFETINPASSKFYGNKTQREACQFLIDTYGLDRVIAVIEKTLPRTNGMKYFPTIISPVQLQDKWAVLESAIIKHKSETNTGRGFA